MLSFGFSGCAWLIPYQLGVARCIKEVLPRESFLEAKYVGTSAGSLTAAALASDSDLEKTITMVHTIRRKSDEHFFGPVGNGTQLLKEGLQQMVKPGTFEKVNGRLYISITEQGNSFIPVLRNRLVSHFSSDEELLETLLASCYIPWYYESRALIKDQPFFDGGFSNNIPRIDRKTITVSPYSNSSALIKPREKVEHSILDAFIFVPDIEKMKQLEMDGYSDAHSLLPNLVAERFPSLQLQKTKSPSLK